MFWDETRVDFELNVWESIRIGDEGALLLEFIRFRRGFKWFLGSLTVFIDENCL